jgi:6-pyruvoyltetrahydropterin/6-carboxytetrahydropterin synthase
MIRVIQRYDFSAAHVLARSDWSEARNRSVYGKCANPSGHGHDYCVEIALSGELDPRTGRLLPEGRLDEIVSKRVLQPLQNRFLNREVPAFAVTVPTAENIAKLIWDTLVFEVAPAHLFAVRLIETRNNSVEYRGREVVD